MSNYLVEHYKGKYRIKAPFDLRTNQFPRKTNGMFEDVDCYIDCYNKIRIYHYGKSVLEAYIPSIIRGHNIVKAIIEEHGSIINCIEESESEVMFRFNSKDMAKLEKYLRPKTNGANISPFSAKNLPKNKSYKIPDEDLVNYKKIVAKIPKKRILELTHTTNDYLKTLIIKDNNWDQIKADMAIKGLKGKEYIHSIGNWNEYIEYLNKNIRSEDNEN